MKKKIRLLLFLFASLFLTIVGLQVYFNWLTWNSEQEIFKRKVHESLVSAKARTWQDHLNKSASHLATFLRDSTEISCRWNPESFTTTFTIKDKDSSSIGQHTVTLSLDQIKARYDRITPEIREKFILQFCENIKSDLKNSTLWYYTANIGRHMEKYYFYQPIDLREMEQNFSNALAENGIHYPFLVNDSLSGGWSTEKVDLSLYKPHGPHYFWASFNPPITYFLKQQLVSIIGTWMLIALSLITFLWIYKTLYTQEKLSEEKDLFITNMTHEIQTPVTAIQLASEALEQLDCTEEERRIFLKRISKNAASLAQLSTEILLESKLGTQNEILHLKTVIHEAAQLFPNLTYQLDRDHLIMGKKEQLFRVFRNLFDNSTKYNNNENVVVKIDAFTKGKTLEIRVSDNGIGIPVEHSERIFERFYRIPSTEVRGFGVGLSYVKKIIEGMKGTIKMVSAQGGGSTFIITLPK
ncbi:integral membrane sensor signal transduction histidine kinase [Leadbetterella byssophila DSM 17132]|uniref:histidine kinase n=1 Tax=Leadbetterella byssophila (strain DSM 17132 / JCM 16389 / KACC 11308 / NBRC 106382 / 4M15) TaxID=649349 RepID=E4RZP4_LEAB4|nr:HAMP domain-containing sensor histidine kinase [Leadbetterella byssophila]ADQ18287.1 integral membrane sensor signal transduction histidine kinase [Leadbetterella byssophila DSM 17132]